MRTQRIPPETDSQFSEVSRMWDTHELKVWERTYKVILKLGLEGRMERGKYVDVWEGISARVTMWPKGGRRRCMWLFKGRCVGLVRPEWRVEASLEQPLHNPKPGNEDKAWKVWHLYCCQGSGVRKAQFSMSMRTVAALPAHPHLPLLKTDL